MDKVAQPDQFYQLVSLLKVGLLSRAQDLLEEHILCSLKIKQLKLKGFGDSDQIALLENIRKEDEKRLIEMLRSTDNEGI